MFATCQTRRRVFPSVSTIVTGDVCGQDIYGLTLFADVNPDGVGSTVVENPSDIGDDDLDHSNNLSDYVYWKRATPEPFQPVAMRGHRWVFTKGTVAPNEINGFRIHGLWKLAGGTSPGAVHVRLLDRDQNIHRTIDITDEVLAAPYGDIPAGSGEGSTVGRTIDVPIIYDEPIRFVDIVQGSATDPAWIRLTEMQTLANVCALSYIDITDVIAQLPVGSEQIVNGKWRDLNASVSTPATNFQLVINGQVIAAAVATPGDVTSGDVQFVGYDTGAVSLGDDGKPMYIRFTDSQGNLVNSGEVILHLPTNDPLRELPGHPAPYETDWEWFTPPTWVNDSQSWTTSPAYGGGVLLKEEHKLRLTGTAANAGTHNFKFQVNLKSPGDVGVRIEVHNLTESFEEDNWTEHEPFDVVSDGLDEDAHNLDTTFTVYDGEQYEITFTPVIAAGSSVTTIDDTNAPYFTLSILKITNVNPPPPQPATWEWNAGDITQADWNAYVASLPNSATHPTQKAGDNLTSIQFDATNGYRFMTPLNYQVPTMTGDGKLRASRETGLYNGDLHCLVSPRKTGTGSAPFSGGQWLDPGEYMETITFNFDSAGFSELDWRSLTPSQWVLLWERHHQNSGLGGSWSGSVEAPIALYCYNDEFRIQVKGAAGTALNGYTEQNVYTWRFAPGKHEFTVHWKVSWDSFSGIGTDGFVRVFDNNILRYETTQAVGVNGGGGGAGKLWGSAGVYAPSAASQSNGPAVNLTGWKLEEL